jgi:short-subunit dehydrogenase
MEIKDKVAIIVGASGGIGSAIAKHLAELGAKVVLVGRDGERLTLLARQLPATLPILADITKPEDAQELVNRTVKEFGRIDILVNSAGRAMFAPVESIDLAEYRDLLELNLIAPLRLMQLVVPHMRAQGQGVILNLSSMVTKRYIPKIAGYASTKYALNAISLTAREEVAKDHIVISVVRPGIVDTDFGKHAKSSEPDALRHSPEGTLLPHVLSPVTVAQKVAEVIQSGVAELDITPGTA